MRWWGMPLRSSGMICTHTPGLYYRVSLYLLKQKQRAPTLGRCRLGEKHAFACSNTGSTQNHGEKAWDSRASCADNYLVGADVEAPVDLHGVGADDLPAQGLCQAQGSGRLAHGCGAGEHDDSLLPGGQGMLWACFWGQPGVGRMCSHCCRLIVCQASDPPMAPPNA